MVSVPLGLEILEGSKAKKDQVMLAGKLKVMTAILAAGSALGQTTALRQPIARVGDQSIYEEDLQSLISGQLYQLKIQEYDLKVQALQTLASQRLLAEEAKGHGLSVDAFLTQTVDRNLAPIGAGELEAYYLAQKD